METIAPHSFLLERMPAMQNVLSANAADIDRQGRFPNENFETLGKLGLMGLVVPETEGGADASADFFSSVVSFLAESCASTAMIFVMHCCATDLIVQLADRSIRAELLKQIVDGRHLSTLACSEPGTGANFYASFGESKLEKDAYVLNAVKAFVTSGGYADSYVVSTRAVGETDCLKSALYLVPSSASGISFDGVWDGLGLRGNSSVPMKLENVKVPKNHLLGEQGHGLEYEMSLILPRFLLGTAAVYCGIARSALNATIDHLKNRVHKHTDKPLSGLPVLRQELGEMKVLVRAIEALMTDAAHEWDHSGKPDLIELFEVKQFACSTAVDVARSAMQLCGGLAYARVSPIERHLRDAMAGVVMAPSNEMLLDLIGRAALNMPLMD